MLRSILYTHRVTFSYHVPLPIRHIFIGPGLVIQEHGRRRCLYVTKDMASLRIVYVQNEHHTAEL